VPEWMEIVQAEAEDCKWQQQQSRRETCWKKPLHRYMAGNCMKEALGLDR